MKIVRMGEKNTAPVKDSCTYCWSVLEFSRSEVTLWEERQPADGGYVVCPVCGKNVYVVGSQIEEWRRPEK